VRVPADEGADVTIAYPEPTISAGAWAGVYPPQYDSWLLIDVLRTSGVATGRRVADLCTGSGVVAVAAATMGAGDVTAFDVCPIAASCAQANAAAAGVRVNVRLGSWTRAQDGLPFDVVVANPPYMPVVPNGDTEPIPPYAGPARAWDAGPQGRDILDPLCDSAAGLLTAGGTLLLVQSEFADISQSLQRLRATGLAADVVGAQVVPFGPVLRARVQWLESTGRLRPGCREEQLVVIRADKS
jgi:release factor glutamine methyltransferase